ncbi:MAG: peptidylprolyl isomerase, partial [Planctomycetaceae bacterium]
MPRACLILLSVLSLTGCDILGTSKVDNPVFGPPPPRVGMADPPQESRFAKNFPGKSDTDGRVRMVDFDTTRDKLASTSELAGTQVVATVNGSPIFASEVLEPFGADLRKARQQLPPEKFEEARLGLIQSQLKSHILRKLLAERLRSTLEKEQLERLDQAINAMYDDHVNGLKKQFKVNTEHEVDLELQKQQDTSLARLKNGFAVQAMAAAYREGKVEPKLSLGRPELLAYYESHPEEFDYPTRIHWRYLTVMFEKHGGREKALARLEQAVNKLRANEPFAAVAESFSDAPNAKQGG